MRILVAYSNQHAATRRTAAHIAETLRQLGLDVTLQHADAAGRIGQYDAFVIGGAAWRSHWLNEAARFVRLHWMLLADRPVWLFSTGAIEPDTVDSAGRDSPQMHAPREFGEFAGMITPRDSRVFISASTGGHRSIGVALGLWDRFIRVMPSGRPAPRGDLVDRRAIQTWSESIARQLALIGA